LASALAQLPAAAWGQPQPDDELTNPGYRIATLIQGTHPKPAAVLFRFVLDEFAPIWTAWVAEVPAHAHIGPHVDQGPYCERWHIPIRPAGTFNGLACTAGVAFLVAHWLPHRVDNPTDVTRVHLVIDRDVRVDVPTAPFQRIEEP
jgi:hypothetical protein